MKSFLISNELRNLTPPMCGNPRPFISKVKNVNEYQSVTSSVLNSLSSNKGVYVETTAMSDIISKLVLDLSPLSKVRVCLATSALCIGLWNLLRTQNRSLTVGYAVERVINYSDEDKVVFVTANYLDRQRGDYLIIDERVIYENTILPSNGKYIIITKSKITPLPYPSIDLIERSHTVSRYYFSSSILEGIKSIISRESGFKGALFCTQPDMFILKNLYPSMVICNTDENIDPDIDFIIDLFPSSKGESLNRLNSLGQRKEGRAYTLLSVDEYKNLQNHSIRKSPPPFSKPLSSWIIEKDIKNYYYLRVGLAIDCMLFAFQSNPFLEGKSEKFFGKTMIHTYTNLFLYLINDLTRMAKQDKESKARSFTLNTERVVDDSIITDKTMPYTLDQFTGTVSNTERKIKQPYQFTSSVEWYVHSWCEDNKIKEKEILSFLKIFNSEEILLLEKSEWYLSIQGWNPLLDFELYDEVSNYLVDVAKEVLPFEYNLRSKNLLSYDSSLISNTILTTTEDSPAFCCKGTESKELKIFPSSRLCTFMLPKEEIDTSILVGSDLIFDSIVENIDIKEFPIDISLYPVTVYPSTLFSSPFENILDYIKKAPIPLYMDKGLKYNVEPIRYSKVFTKQERGRIICYIRFLNSYKNIQGLKVLLVGISVHVASYIAELYPSISFLIYETEENNRPQNLTFHKLPFKVGVHLILSGLRTGSSELFQDQNRLDMQAQYDVLELVNPSLASLIRLVPEKGRDFETYSGKILIVPWSEPKSRETFLEISSGAKKLLYKGSYYDNYLRFIHQVQKEMTYKTDLVGGKCSDSCYNCTNEKLAFSELTSSKDVSKEMDKLSSVIFDDLCLESHN